jgi:hypothetical protein
MTEAGAAGLAASGSAPAAAAGSEDGAASPETGLAHAGHVVAVQAGAVAKGVVGAADAFTLTAPVRAEGAAVVSLGVVAGFSAGEGDRLVFANGVTPTVVEVTELQPFAAHVPGVEAEAGRRIGYDLNGDGREDAYVVVLDAPAPVVLHKAADTAFEPAVTVQGVAPAASLAVVFIVQ